MPGTADSTRCTTNWASGRPSCRAWAPGALYKYELEDRHGALLPLRADPCALAAELRPSTASVVTACRRAAALPPERAALNRRDAPISVFEVHAQSWRKGRDGGFPSWEELANSLPAYAAGLGFTHLELLPISEHPFDGSWGYQTLGLFAPSRRFGDPAQFGLFVQACHDHGLGLLLDWVPAHFPTDAHGLARFDGTALYEYLDAREGFHQDWNTYIPNFGRDEVRAFLSSSALYWVERWGVDGLRVDAVASMLYRDYSRAAGQWIPNHQGGRENLEAIALLKHVNEQVSLAGGITVAEESTSFPGVSQPTYAGGLGFHFKWNMGWMNDTLRYIQQDPVHRRHHHHQMTFGLVYAFSENFLLPISHDEVVHGKGSLWDKMPGDPWQKASPTCAPTWASCGGIPARSCSSWARSGASAANGTKPPACPGIRPTSRRTPASAVWWRTSTSSTAAKARCTNWIARAPASSGWSRTTRRTPSTPGCARIALAAASWWCATSPPCRAMAIG
jgi:1,4-alpha-glucan branching enzyme